MRGQGTVGGWCALPDPPAQPGDRHVAGPGRYVRRLCGAAEGLLLAIGLGRNRPARGTPLSRARPAAPGSCGRNPVARTPSTPSAAAAAIKLGSDFA